MSGSCSNQNDSCYFDRKERADLHISASFARLLNYTVNYNNLWFLFHFPWLSFSIQMWCSLVKKIKATCSFMCDNKLAGVVNYLHCWRCVYITDICSLHWLRCVWVCSFFPLFSFCAYLWRKRCWRGDTDVPRGGGSGGGGGGKAALESQVNKSVCWRLTFVYGLLWVSLQFFYMSPCPSRIVLDNAFSSARETLFGSAHFPRH